MEQDKDGEWVKWIEVKALLDAINLGYCRTLDEVVAALKSVG